ncbi:MAG: hypothetical protein M1819_005793 [Sarea resinae]|nr:MAG: hypothetical protein M1819_005793 [Sarea resinae]
MAKGKKGAPRRAPKRGSTGVGASSSRGSTHSSFVPPHDIAGKSDNSHPTNSRTKFERQHFSLREEARNTERHHSFWSSDLNLRHNKVNFISAGDFDTKQLTEPSGDNGGPTLTGVDGTSEPIIASPVHPESAFADMNLNSSAPVKLETDTITSLQHAPLASSLEQNELDVNRSIDLQQGDGEPFVVDTVGSQVPISTGLPPPVIRSHSDSQSDSSEELLLFRGRNPKVDVLASEIRSRPSQIIDSSTKQKGNDDQQKMHFSVDRQRGRSVDSEERTISLGYDPTTWLMRKLRPLNERTSSRKLAMFGTAATPTSKSPSRYTPFSGSNTKASHALEKGKFKRMEEDAILADYLSNIRESGEVNDLVRERVHNRRELGGTDTDGWQDITEGSASEAKAPVEVQKKSGWGPSELHDFDDLSTSEEVDGAVEHILSRRERANSIQYLVVYQGYTVDDARWIPASCLTIDDALQKLHDFEEEEKLVKEYHMHDSDSSEERSGDEGQDEEFEDDGEDEDEDDNWDDEQDLVERKLERMSDERIARLLSKQEELGLGSEDLLLLDDDEEEGEEEEEYLRREIQDIKTGSHRGFRSVSADARTNRLRGRRSKQSGGGYPSATLMADVLTQDAYNGFDVMDHERPSLRKKAKGRRGPLPFELSDSEIEASLRVAWTNDRNKKKARKEEREELRAQGLLGRKNKNKNKADLKTKYKEGMTLDEVKDEIKEFLISRHESLSLPPMDKRDRKIVHNMANSIGLKSKSVGGGRSRFPVLYKTSSTSFFDEEALDYVESRLDQRRFLSRMDKRGSKAKGVKAPRRTGGGFASAAVSYRDGDVVGAAAPELGVENKGRAMLEKMGWSSGTALGALNNKGILQPVAHVVKTTKAGLG